MKSSWNQVQFALSLNESLVAAMEAEAQWMIANNLTTSTQIPNFLDYVEENNLKAVKPESVNVIR
jgi:NitT/TauT family transport system substrate-binding protein